MQGQYDKRPKDFQIFISGLTAVNFIVLILLFIIYYVLILLSKGPWSNSTDTKLEELLELRVEAAIFTEIYRL
jgi:hypothetical protein